MAGAEPVVRTSGLDAAPADRPDQPDRLGRWLLAVGVAALLLSLAAYAAELHAYSVQRLTAHA